MAVCGHEIFTFKNRWLPVDGESFWAPNRIFLSFDGIYD
jgi:hypothetical protein